MELFREQLFTQLIAVGIFQRGTVQQADEVRRNRLSEVKLEVLLLGGACSCHRRTIIVIDHVGLIGDNMSDARKHSMLHLHVFVVT